MVTLAYDFEQMSKHLHYLPEKHSRTSLERLGWFQPLHHDQPSDFVKSIFDAH